MTAPSPDAAIVKPARPACPYDGHDMMVLSDDVSRGCSEPFFAWCLECHARGPKRDSPEAAIAAALSQKVPGQFQVKEEPHP